MPKINEIFLKLECFKYATSLDLNIEYYYIQLMKAKVTYIQLLFCRGDSITSIYQC